MRTAPLQDQSITEIPPRFGLHGGAIHEMIASPSRRKIERLLIVRLSAMGDVIHTLPAVQLLRDAFPAASIGWLIEERWAELLCAPDTSRRGPRSPQRPVADWVHTVNLTAWRKSLWSLRTIEEIATVWNDVRAMHYEAAVDLQGAIRSAVLAQCSAASVIWGSAEPRESPASILYTREIIPYGRHVVEQNASLAAEVAGKDNIAVPRPELPREPRIEEQIEDHLASRQVRSFVILNPGAGWGAKRWPAERYGQVARVLGEQGLRSVINYGPGEEALAAEAEAASHGAAFGMQLSITGLIAITRHAGLFIGGDTGPMHLAAALQVPVVAIFGPTDPARNGPYGTRSIVLRSAASPTTHKRRPEPDQGMLEISTEGVIMAAMRLLSEETI